MKDLCDETWDELYGSEYGMSDALPCEPMYSFFCSGWNKGSMSGEAMKDMQVRLFKLEKENAELRDMPHTDNSKVIDYLKSVIKSLLDNSDEYARQRAMDAVKE